MAEINFYLKDQNSHKLSPILLLYYTSNFRFKYYTGESCTFSDWNADKQRVSRSRQGYQEINQYLKALEEEAKRFHRQRLASHLPFDKEILKDHLDQFRGKKKEKKHPVLQEALNEYIAAKKDKFSTNYIKTIRTMQNHLLAFQVAAKYKLTYDTVDLKFYDKFTSYLYSQGCTNNTVGINIARLKRFLDWSVQSGYTKNVSFKERGFKVIETPTEIIALTFPELIALYNLDLSARPRLNNVRETFCFGCFTGLRYSDISQITEEAVKDRMLHLTIRKTKENLTIPLNDYAYSILVRNNFDLPVISNQKTNAFIKEVCKLAGIDSPTKQTRFRGTERIEVTRPKYECIATHAARRTFVTLSLEKGLRPEVVMSISGHKNYNNFRKYIQLTDQVRQTEMMRVWGMEEKG